MSSRNMRRLALLLAVFTLGSIPVIAQDAPSVAEAARRSRQQKQDAAKPSPVIDNDVIPPSPLAAAPAADANAAAPAPTGTPADAATKKADGAKDGDDESKKGEIEALKKEIASQKEKIALQQREMTLAQDSFLSNADHEHDKAGKEKLDGMQSDITQAQS